MIGEPQRSRLERWYNGAGHQLAEVPLLAEMCREYRVSEPGSLEERRDRLWNLRMNIHRNLAPGLAEVAVQAIAEYAYGWLAIPRSPQLAAPVVVDVARLLGEHGYAFLPQVDAAFVDRLLRWLDGQPAVRDGSFANWTTTQAFRAPGLFELANVPLILRVVERYLQVPPIITNYSAWRSKVGAGAKGSQHFHRDYDDLRFVKLFVYLTDVDDKDDGPHCFVDGSHRVEAVAALRAGWPGGVEEFEKWYFGALRKGDADVGAVFGDKAAALVGKAGTCFLVDTAGIHKGIPPVRKDRVVAQVLYGVTPHYVWYDREFPTREARMLSPLDYVNMLWLA